jgi:hypothetical protein
MDYESSNHYSGRFKKNLERKYKNERTITLEMKGNYEYRINIQEKQLKRRELSKNNYMK